MPELFPTKPPKFGFERNGTFNHDSWCWEAGPRILHYRIRVTTNNLDEHGFILDNRAIESYFATNFEGKKTDGSCERIAAQVLEDICAMIPNCNSIEVGITGNPSATWMTAIHTVDSLSPLA